MIAFHINTLREAHKLSPFAYHSWRMENNCYAHTQAMIERGEAYSAPECFLEGWREIVKKYHVATKQWEEARFKLVFEDLRNDEDAMLVILTSRDLAIASLYHKDHLYVTIRGR